MVAASTQLFLIKEKAMETFKYVCLDKRFSSNVKRAKKWQQILQFSLVQQAYKEKEEETCRKEQLEK